MEVDFFKTKYFNLILKVTDTNKELDKSNVEINKMM